MQQATAPQINIQNAKNIEQPYTRWFIYGPTGAGKTQAASTFPDPFFILPPNENSILTLQGLDVPFTLAGTRSEMDNVVGYLKHNYAEMLRLYEAAGDDEAKQAAALEVFPYQTIVVENLSHYCELLVEDISRSGQNKMDQQAWGLLASHLRTLHSQLSDIDVHVVYTSLDTVDDSGTGRPMMTGKNAIIMPSSCDVIAHCETIISKKSEIFRMHFRKTGRFPARSRFRNFPSHVDDFHYQTFMEQLNGGS